MLKEYERHELSRACSDMNSETFVGLCASVLERGVDDAMTLYEGKILDGWHRYQALRAAFALKATVPHKFDEFEGTPAEAVAFVDRRELRRDSTQDMRAQRIASHREWLRLRVPDVELPSLREVSEAEGIGERTLERANVVARQAIPQVRDAVLDGTISLKQGEQIARLPTPKEQKKALRSPPKPQSEQKSPAWRAAPGAAPAPRPVVGASLEAMDELREKVAILAEENDRLNDRLAVHFLQGSDEERLTASAVIEELRTQLRGLTAENNAIKAERDHYRGEAQEAIRQCGIYRSQLAKLKG